MFQFPSWTITFRDLTGVVLLVAPLYVVGVIAFGASPKTTDVGYQPAQPIEFSHALHAGELGLDCRYCHNTVEKASHAAVPASATCMGCHKAIKTESPRLTLMRETFERGAPIAWKRVHDLPDFAFFDHSAHVNRGIGCVTCHGPVDTMERVHQHAPLSMSWCLDCHRDPTQYLRPLDQITNMRWQPDDQRAVGTAVKNELGIVPSENCSTCHR